MYFPRSSIAVIVDCDDVQGDIQVLQDLAKAPNNRGSVVCNFERRHRFALMRLIRGSNSKGEAGTACKPGDDRGYGRMCLGKFLRVRQDFGF